jgi:methylthioribose-1-phosphate isomerase
MMPSSESPTPAGPATATAVESIHWEGDYARIIDQTFLPGRKVYCDIRDVGQMWDAIKKLKIRGAPAIGIAAAYGFYLGMREVEDVSFKGFMIEARRVAEYLSSSRPTAVNLQWALDRQLSRIAELDSQPLDKIKAEVLETARIIHEEDKQICRDIGLHGQNVVPENARILTHCNTGSLATGKYGTALSVIYHAHSGGKNIHVWVDETRPLLQGARLTAWELTQAEIPMKLLVDSAAGHLMKSGQVDLVITGTDRVAANGDTANKIGTYPLAVLARENNIPFYIAAPLSAIDLSISTGADIPIEERGSEEITQFGTSPTAPPKIDTYNPAFDVTPVRYITGFITEKGIVPADKELESAFRKLIG